MPKHHSKPHGTEKGLSIAAHQVLENYKRKLEAEYEEIRLDYQRQLEEKGADDWMRSLATSVQVFYEITGSRQKTEKFAEKLAEKLSRYRREETPTADIIAEVERLTDISIQVED